MIALITTAFLVFYILIPGILFRFAASLFPLKLKSFERSRTQEATFAVSVALLPFALAYVSVWSVPVVRHYPFPVDEGTFAERRADYRRVGELLLTSDLAKLAGCIQSASPCPGTQPYWTSVNLVLHRQARFLAWFFLATFLEGLGFGLLASKYGDWRSTPRNRRNPFVRLYDIVARRFILPNLSEWHVLLTGFNWPRDVLVVADILQNDGRLYRGRVEDYFVDTDGKLTGILLRHVDRFDLHAYRRDQEIAEATPSPSASRPELRNPEFRNLLDRDLYWKMIPSENFYIGQNAILNLNIRFAPDAQEAFAHVTYEVLSSEDINGTISVTENEPEDADSGAHPDLYT
jgi:hypothetical protein